MSDPASDLIDALGEQLDAPSEQLDARIVIEPANSGESVANHAHTGAKQHRVRR